MNLDEFIKESLLQLLKGVKEAQENSEDNGKVLGIINPKWGEDKDYHKYTSEVVFDIAISVVEQKDTGGKASVKVPVFEIGGGREVSLESSSVSRVSFKLPVSFRVVPVPDVDALPEN